ncbi:sensor histidine kinase [Mahella australiensis]|uniref:Signal transduction histidine kinase, LytS n=1 Tax=Mahella australiensis (strain DSM 15567 / CIP 107919 / 50-1 BON) TaxID=697281 RepID=F4A2K1_MAHA5|nr:histidine kinase [Mahella australiensis]AEE97267.1 signal transduction histidine kinase, LytS [Mahella australiensis 50-1 BON]
MLHFNKLKLKQQLVILIFLIIVIMLAMQMFYYYAFDLLTKKRAVNYVNTLMNQVEDQLKVLTENIEKEANAVSYNLYIQDYIIFDNPIQRLEIYPMACNTVDYVKSLNDNINDIYIICKQDKIFTTSRDLKINVIEALDKIYDFKGQNFIKPTYTSVVKENDDLISNIAYVMPVFSIKSSAEYLKKIGVTIFFIETTFFHDIVSNLSVTKNSIFMILDSENNIIAGNNELKSGEHYEISQAEDKYGKDKVIIQTKTMNNTGWQIVSIIPTDELTADMLPLRSFGILIILIITLVLLFFTLLFGYSITSPISKLAESMSHIGEKNIEWRLHVEVNNEIGLIANDINKMLDKIEDMTRRIISDQSMLYEAELAKKQAQISALQNQITPHFLYNTLNCISGIAMANEIMEIANICAAVSRIFRYSAKEADIVYVKEEIECIKDYLNIMIIRYPYKFNIIYDIEESILDLKTFKMMLQPLVENAIYHGLEPKKGKGNLLISGRIISNDLLRFEINDDGIGINKDSLEQLKKYLDCPVDTWYAYPDDKRSIGLLNINKRIKLLWGENYGIELESGENIGTKVIVDVPVISDR